MVEYEVRLNIDEATTIVYDHLMGWAEVMECTDQKTWYTPDKKHAFCQMVFQQYYFRTGSWASLSVFVTNMQGRTIVRAVGSGGGSSMLFNMDWGVANAFEKLVTEALQGYILTAHDS